MCRAVWLLLLLPAMLAGETHHVAAEVYHRTFSRAHPVLKRIRPGDIVVTKTIDAGGQDEKGVQRSEPSFSA